MKLKTEPNIFQGIMLVIWLLFYLAICSVVGDHIEAAGLLENQDWITIVIIYVLLFSTAPFVSKVLQFAFGLPWFFGDSSKTCALSFYWLDKYQPSLMEISHTPYLGNYEVELKLVLNARDLELLDGYLCPRSGLNYFLLFEGYFPFDEKRKTELYLTRAALRQVRRAIKNIDDDADEKTKYVQFEFELEIPYCGRDISLSEGVSYLLSRWDINELEWMAKKRKDLSFGDLILSPEDLAQYRSRLKNAELDTFIKVESEH